MSDITQILSSIESGDSAAAEKLLTLVYDELRRLAAAKMVQEKPGQTLQATALVHEAWLRLTGGNEPQVWNSRNHFFAAAAEAMRRILVESARRKISKKRGGDREREVLDSHIAAQSSADEIIAVHEALDELRQSDALAAELVQLHYFGGFSLEETAELLGMSRASAYRMWTYARTWLKASLRPNSPPS